MTGMPYPFFAMTAKRTGPRFAPQARLPQRPRGTSASGELAREKQNQHPGGNSSSPLFSFDIFIHIRQRSAILGQLMNVTKKNHIPLDFKKPTPETTLDHACRDRPKPLREPIDDRPIHPPTEDRGIPASNTLGFPANDHLNTKN